MEFVPSLLVSQVPVKLKKKEKKSAKKKKFKGSETKINTFGRTT